MSASEDVMLVPGSAGFQSWRARGKGVAAPDPDARPKRAAWVALPVKSLVSVPMRFHGVDAGRREPAAQLELEAIGYGAEAQQAHLFESRVNDPDARDSRAWICAQVAPLPKDVIDSGIDARYAPSACFQRFKEGQMAVWEEDGSLAIAIPDAEGRPVHSQALTGREADADAAAEIRCILAAMELAGAAPEIDSISLRLGGEAGEEGGKETGEFSAALDLPVAAALPVPPQTPADAWRLVPDPVVKKRQARKQRATTMLVGAGMVLAIVAALGAYAAGLWKRGQDLAREEAYLASLEPRLDVIRGARDSWTDLQTALLPDQYPVELFYQVVKVLPPEGVRLTLFEVNDSGMVLAGEASSVQHAIGLREDLSSSPVLKEWGFADNFPSPEVLPDNRATFHAEGHRPAFAAATP